MKTDYVQLTRMMGNLHCFVVVLYLSRGHLSLDELAELTGFTPTNVAYQIKRLRDKGMVRGDRLGHQKFYCLDENSGIRDFLEQVVCVFRPCTRLAA